MENEFNDIMDKEFTNIVKQKKAAGYTVSEICNDLHFRYREKYTYDELYVKIFGIALSVPMSRRVFIDRGDESEEIKIKYQEIIEEIIIKPKKERKKRSKVLDKDEDELIVIESLVVFNKVDSVETSYFYGHIIASSSFNAYIRTSFLERDLYLAERFGSVIGKKYIIDSFGDYGFRHLLSRIIDIPEIYMHHFIRAVVDNVGKFYILKGKLRFYVYFHYNINMRVIVNYLEKNNIEVFLYMCYHILIEGDSVIKFFNLLGYENTKLRSEFRYAQAKSVLNSLSLSL